MKKDKIVATLTYGKVYSKGVLILILTTLLMLIIMIPLTIYCAIDSSEYEVLLCLVMPIIGFIGLPYLIYFWVKTDKSIKQWKKDAVKLWAVTKELDSITNTFLRVRKIKIKVQFEYNDKKITQVSGELNDIRESIFYMQPGYDAVFQKYANKRIEILYSQQYKQVMILKPTKEKN